MTRENVPPVGTVAFEVRRPVAGSIAYVEMVFDSWLETSAKRSERAGGGGVFGFEGVVGALQPVRSMHASTIFREDIRVRFVDREVERQTFRRYYNGTGLFILT